MEDVEDVEDVDSKVERVYVPSRTHEEDITGHLLERGDWPMLTLPYADEARAEIESKRQAVVMLPPKYSMPAHFAPDWKSGSGSDTDPLPEVPKVNTAKASDTSGANEQPAPKYVYRNGSGLGF